MPREATDLLSYMTEEGTGAATEKGAFPKARSRQSGRGGGRGQRDPVRRQAEEGINLRIRGTAGCAHREPSWDLLISANT